MLRVVEFSDQGFCARTLGYDLSKKLIELKGYGSKVLLLLSGGSSFEPLRYVDVDIFGEYLTIGVLDERFGGDENNNFFQLTNTAFYKVAKEMGCKFISTMASDYKTKEDLAQQFEIEVKTWVGANPHGVIVATMGMGEDGHTSGMMPFPEDSEQFKKLFEGEDWVESYDTGMKNKFPLRVTTTMTFLRRINFAYGYICGEKKREAFNKLKSGVEINELPIKIVEEMPEVVIYSDITS